MLQKGFPFALISLDTLREENDLIIIEGAGSPAEINIQRYDIANMLLANQVKAPVIISTDIERGGCFASIVGTMRLLKPFHRQLIKGFIINKFRGDKNLLDFSLPNEDSLDKQLSDNRITNELQWNEQINLIAEVVYKSIDIQELSNHVIGFNK